MGDRDQVFLEGVELFGRLGVLHEEKRKGQRFVLDIAMGVDLSAAGTSDSLAQTVNYAAVFEMAKELMDAARYDLIESYAEALASSILEAFARVSFVKVVVRKPEAPIEGRFKSVGVEIVRER